MISYKITLDVENSIHINWIHILQIVLNFAEHIFHMDIAYGLTHLCLCSGKTLLKISKI